VLTNRVSHSKYYRDFVIEYISIKSKTSKDQIIYQETARKTIESYELTTDDFYRHRDPKIDWTKVHKKNKTVSDIIQKLKKTYKLSLYSNGTYPEVTATLCICGLLNYFHPIITKANGFPKPHKSKLGFQFVKDQIGIGISDLIMVGDKEFVDIAPFKKIGGNTINVESELDLSEVYKTIKESSR